MSRYLDPKADGAVSEIKEAVDLAEEAAYTEAELMAYEAYWDAVSTEKTLLSGRYQEGRAEGRAEGLTEGEKMGEQKKSFEIAKNLIKSGISRETIIACTGLTAEEIDTI